MDKVKSLLYWLGLANGEPVAFAELARRMAAAQFVGDTDRAALERAVAEDNIAEYLVRMVAERRLTVRNPLGLTPLDAPMGEQLRRAVLLPRDLEPLREEFGIEPPPPCFVREARPLQVPSELLKLPPDAVVRYVDPTWRDSSGAGQCSAGQLRGAIEERIKRQAEGLYTVGEAAQVLAEHRAGTEPKEWAEAMWRAQRSGTAAQPVPIRSPSTLLPLEPGATRRDFLDVVRVDDVDAWLQRIGAGIRFPGDNGAVSQRRAEPNPHAAATPTWTLRRLKRDDGLAMAVFRVLKAAHDCGAPKPKAREVLESFRTSRPPEVLKVTENACDYLDPRGDAQTADVENIRKRIQGMTAVQAPRKSR